MSSPKELLTLVTQLQESLAACLNSLGGRPRNGLEEAFKGFCASHINRAAEGFVVLKGGNRDYSARLLVRPAMEAMFKLLAVKTDPSALYGIARYEHDQDKKWSRPFAPGGEGELTKAFDEKWKQFTEAYRGQHTEQELIPSPIGVRGAAERAHVDRYYDSHYRLYCQYTHAALRATTGDLDTFSGEDERVVGFALIVAIEAVQEFGGLCDPFPSLRSAFFQEVQKVDKAVVDNRLPAPSRNEPLDCNP